MPLIRFQCTELGVQEEAENVVLLRHLSIENQHLPLSARADLSVMQDLKQLLVEAGQELPAFLRELALDAEPAPTGDSDDKGCSYCSGLGHRITNCPKLAGIQNKTAQSLTRAGPEDGRALSRSSASSVSGSRSRSPSSSRGSRSRSASRRRSANSVKRQPVRSRRRPSRSASRRARRSGSRRSRRSASRSASRRSRRSASRSASRSTGRRSRRSVSRRVKRKASTRTTRSISAKNSRRSVSRSSRKSASKRRNGALHRGTPVKNKSGEFIDARGRVHLANGRFAPTTVTYKSDSDDGYRSSSRLRRYY